MTHEEALKQALAAMREARRFVWHYANSNDTTSIAERFDAAIHAAFAALAAPAAEPVLWECKAGGLRPLTQRQYDAQTEATKKHYSRISAAPAAEPVATYSPCCRMLREGRQPPDVMHDGLCRGKHGGELGPTVLLYAEPVARKLTDEQIIDLWSPPIGGDVRRPVLGKNKIIAFARSVIATSQAEPVARKPPLTDEEIGILIDDFVSDPDFKPWKIDFYAFARAVERAHGIE